MRRKSVICPNCGSDTTETREVSSRARTFLCGNCGSELYYPSASWIFVFLLLDSIFSEYLEDYINAGIVFVLTLLIWMPILWKFFSTPRVRRVGRRTNTDEMDDD